MKNNDTCVSPVSKRYLILVASMASFLVPFMGSSINIALPSIGSEFSMTAISLAWVATSFLLASAAFLVPIGRIADIYGKEQIFIAGISIYTAVSFLSVFAGSAFVLITLRAVQGVAGAMIYTTPIALITSVFTSRERGKALGINVASVYLGLSLGPFVGGILTEYFNWRSIFLLNALLGFVTLVIVLWKLRGVCTETLDETFDTAGAVIYGAALVFLMYGFSGLPAVSGILFCLAGLAGFYMFWTREENVEHPVFEARFFMRNRVFAFSSLATLVNYSATAAVGFLLSMYLQYIKGFSPKISGTILVIQPVLQAVFSPLAGRLSDSIEPRIVSSWGMAITAAGLTALVFISPEISVFFIAGCLGFLGIGFALFSSPNTNAVMSSVEKTRYGTASGLLATMRQTGMMLSMTVATLVFSLYMGQAGISSLNHHLLMSSVKVIFAILAFLCYCGIYFSLARGSVR